MGRPFSTQRCGRFSYVCVCGERELSVYMKIYYEILMINTSCRCDSEMI